MASGALRIAVPPQSPAVRRRARETIFAEGDAAHGAFEIDSGWVRLVILSEAGDRRVVSFLTVGDGFGFDVETYGLTAEAITDVKLRRLDMETPRPDDSRALREITRQFDAVAHHAWQVLHEPVEQRVLCFLAWLACRQGPEAGSDRVRIPMGRQDIADYLGVAAATLSRTITDLQQAGRIALSGPRLFRIRRPPRIPGCRAAGSICAGCSPQARDERGQRPAPRVSGRGTTRDVTTGQATGRSRPEVGACPRTASSS